MNRCLTGFRRRIRPRDPASPLCGLAALLIAGLARVHGADWPQYRGPTHDGVCSEKILAHWTGGELRPLWNVPLTDGFSSFAVSEGKAVTMVGRNLDGASREVCVALDADTGRELWAVPLGIAKYENGGDTGTPDNSGGDGPRSTPSIDGGRVYATTAQLGLYCLDAATGKSLWSRDLIRENAGKNIGWENAASPLIDGDLVFIMGGQVLVLSDAGELVLAQATPKAYTEVARAKAIAGKCWSAPAVSNGRLYLRSTRAGACLDASPGRVARR